MFYYQSGKACLGDIIYRYITADQFSPECLLDCLDLSSEHHTLEIVNRIEAAVHVWKQKDERKHTNHMKVRRSTWGGKVKGLVADTEKNNLLAQRAETLLQSLRIRFPGLPQTALDMNKIQYNKVPLLVLKYRTQDILYKIWIYLFGFRCHVVFYLVLDAMLYSEHLKGLISWRVVQNNSVL